MLWCPCQLYYFSYAISDETNIPNDKASVNANIDQCIIGKKYINIIIVRTVAIVSSIAITTSLRSRSLSTLNQRAKESIEAMIISNITKTR